MNKTWFIVVFAIQLLATILYSISANLSVGRDWDSVYEIKGDAVEYVGSVEEFFKTGELVFYKSNEWKYASNYETEENFDVGLYYCYRTPGFAFFYYPLRLIFNQHVALSLIILLQTLLNAFAKTLVSKLIYDVTKSYWFATIPLILTCLSYFYSKYNPFLLTESLGASFIIFSLYYIVKSLVDINNPNNKRWFWAGLFMVIAIYLRPFFLINFCGCILAIMLVAFKFRSLKRLIPILFFVIPFVGVTTPWAIRNYIKTNEVILIANTGKFLETINHSLIEQIKLSGWMGQENRMWEGNSIVNWFQHEEFNDPTAAQFNPVYRDKEVMDLLYQSKDFYLISRDSLNSLSVRQKAETKSAKLLNQVQDLLSADFPNPKQYLVSRYNLVMKSLNIPRYCTFEGFSSSRFFSTLSYISNVSNKYIWILTLTCTVFGFMFYKKLYIQLLAGGILLLYGYFVPYAGSLEYREFYLMMIQGLFLIPLFLYEIYRLFIDSSRR